MRRSPVTRFALAALLLGGLAAQDPPPPKKQDKPAAQKPKLPPFPKDKAKWVIRGKARAEAMLMARTIKVPPHLQSEAGRTKKDPRRACNLLDLTLPNVLVHARGLEARWSFGPHTTFRLMAHPDRFEPRVSSCPSPHLLRIGFSDVRVRICWESFDPSGRMIFANQIKSRRAGEVRRIGYMPGGRCSRIEFSLGQKTWARAVVHMVAHSIVAVTDAEGRFTLPELPDGDYTLVAIHELLGRVEKKVTIRGKNPRPVTFVFKVPSKLRAKPRKESRRRRMRPDETSGWIG